VARAGRARTLALLLLTATTTAGLCPPLAAQEEEVPPAEAPSENGLTASEVEPDGDPCREPQLDGADWLDALNLRLYRTVCGSARWFDSFFGTRNTFDRGYATYGWVSTHLVWSEYDGFDPRFRFRARISLPNLNERFNLLLGRMPEDEYLTDTEASASELPGSFRDTLDQDWLVGLGYDPISTPRTHLKFSLGASLGWPPQPYARARYLTHWVLSERHLTRFRQIVFWKRDDGFGTTTSVDLDWRLGRRDMVRWASSGTFSESTRGVLWSTSLTHFHDLGSGRGLAVKYWQNGETDHPVPVREYGLRVTYRQSVWREWLFAEVGGGVFWPRELLEERRQASPLVLAGLEVHFGRKPWLEESETPLDQKASSKNSWSPVCP